jgi:thiol peroxidase
MEARTDLVFAGAEPLTVSGTQLQPGETAPDFCLDYLDLVDLTVRTVGLADSARMVRLLSVINSLHNPLCQHVTHRWEGLCADLPARACIYTVSMDPPKMQARWQDGAGVLHQLLSAWRSDQFGQDYGVWLQEWQQLARAVLVIDRRDRLVYVEYIADQNREPEYGAALEAVQQAAMEKLPG